MEDRPIMSLSGKQTDFNGYELPYSGVEDTGPSETLSRRDAQKDFDYFVSSLDERIAALNRLASRNEGPELDYSDESVLALNEWFVDRCEPEPDQERWPGGLTPEWYGVVNDIKAYLGQILIGCRPHLKWVLSTDGGKRDVDYQKPVISGFQNVPSKKYAVEYGSLVAILGTRVVRNELRDDSRCIFLNVLHTDLERA
jgi:hypothetical protein